MNEEKSLYDLLNEATALTEEQEKEIKANAIKKANELSAKVYEEAAKAQQSENNESNDSKDDVQDAEYEEK